MNRAVGVGGESGEAEQYRFQASRAHGNRHRLDLREIQLRARSGRLGIHQLHLLKGSNGDLLGDLGERKRHGDFHRKVRAQRHVSGLLLEASLANRDNIILKRDIADAERSVGSGYGLLRVACQSVLEQNGRAGNIGAGLVLHASGECRGRLCPDNPCTQKERQHPAPSQHVWILL